MNTKELEQRLANTAKELGSYEQFVNDTIAYSFELYKQDLDHTRDKVAEDMKSGHYGEACEVLDNASESLKELTDLFKTMVRTADAIRIIAKETDK